MLFRIQKIYTKKYGEHDGRVGLAMCSLAHANCAKGYALSICGGFPTFGQNLFDVFIYIAEIFVCVTAFVLEF